MEVSTLAVLVLRLAGSCWALNDRPVIGVMAQETDSEQYGSSYIAASYVKYLEAAGARVVPVLLGRPAHYYHLLADSLNGLLFPGGDVSLTHSDYSKKGWILYKAALKKNEHEKIHFPIWGTCLGFELLLYYRANRKLWMKKCSAQNIPMPLNLTGAPSKLMDSLSEDVRAALGRDNITANFHTWCITPHNFTMSGLDQHLKVISTNKDIHGLEFISTVEDVSLPIYATAWHPEKNQFEFVTRVHHSNIPHSPGAIKMGQEFANFFVNEARKNSQTFPSPEVESRYLIYNYQPVYVGKNGSVFMQNYYFD